MSEELEEEEFVAEDSDDSGDDQEEALQAKIAEEHAKFKEQQQRWREHVRAARPWSAPPLSSPRPESQRIKKNEASEIARAPPSSLSLLPVNPRELYVPPQRAYETGPHGQGDHRPASADMAHLSPPRPASADTLVASQRMLGSFGMVSINQGGLADIQEESPLVTQPETHPQQEPSGAPHSDSNEEDPSNRASQQDTPSPFTSQQPTPATEQGAKDRPSYTLGQEDGSGMSDGDGNGDEDLFRLFDQEAANQALKSNMEDFNKQSQEDLAQQAPDEEVKEEEGSPTEQDSAALEQQPALSAPEEPEITLPSPAAADDAEQADTPRVSSGQDETEEEAGAQQEESSEAPATDLPSPADTPQQDDDAAAAAQAAVSSSCSSDDEIADVLAEVAEEAMQDEQAEEEGGLMSPHQFGLRLMAHDLRTLPAHLSSPAKPSSSPPKSSSPPHSPTPNNNNSSSSPTPAPITFDLYPPHTSSNSPPNTSALTPRLNESSPNPQPPPGAPQSSPFRGNTARASYPNLNSCESSPAVKSPPVDSGVRDVSPDVPQKDQEQKAAGGGERQMIRSLSLWEQINSAKQEGEQADTASVQQSGLGSEHSQQQQLQYGTLKYEEWVAMMMGEGDQAGSKEEYADFVRQGSPEEGSPPPHSHYSYQLSPPSAPSAPSQSLKDVLQGNPNVHGGHAGIRVVYPTAHPIPPSAGPHVSPYYAQPQVTSPYTQPTSSYKRPQSSMQQRRRPHSAHPNLQGGGHTHTLPPHLLNQGLPPQLQHPSFSGDLEAAMSFSPVSASHQPLQNCRVNATAGVHVGGAPVSVYVEDTTRRILEANRWLAGLKMRTRYRLRSRLSNMIVQAYDSTWQQYPMDLEQWEQHDTPTEAAAEAAAHAAPATKELTIKQFLALHLRLKSQAVSAGVAGRPRSASGMGRPKSAGVGGYGFGAQASVTVVRPASQMQRPMSAQMGGRARHAPPPSAFRPYSAAGLSRGASRPQSASVYVPMSVQQQHQGVPEYDGLYDLPGSTVRVQQELEGIASACVTQSSAITRDMGVLSGV